MRYLRRFIQLTVVSVLLILFLQSCWAHRHGMYAPAAAAPGISCRALLPLRITCEERTDAPADLSPPQPGDILITFSTHTLGWRHGHAALVIDEETLLEAAMPGVPSGCSPVSSWETYPTLLVLRVKGASCEQIDAAVKTAVSDLSNIPYGFFSGLSANKAPEPPLSSVQCAYLPWYAWFRQGIDLDSDGGRIVTVADLAASPLLEVVQLRGIDPAHFDGRWTEKTAAACIHERFFASSSASLPVMCSMASSTKPTLSRAPATFDSVTSRWPG